MTAHAYNENDPRPSRIFISTDTGWKDYPPVRSWKRYIPEDITSGVKQGFSAPDATWFKGESIDYVKKIIFNNKSSIYDYFDSKAIQERVNEHLEGKMNRRLFIWSLLNFEWWCKCFLRV
jgi:asparagine synthase (glutamine-hydrolysing)